MGYNFILHLATLIALPSWLMMIFLPKWEVTKRLATSSTWILALCGLYGLLFIWLLFYIRPLLFISNLDSLAMAMAEAHGLTAMLWTHLQAFALLVGIQLYKESRAQDMNPMVASPILLLTMAAGPLGYLVFRVVQMADPGPNKTQV